MRGRPFISLQHEDYGGGNWSLRVLLRGEKRPSAVSKALSSWEMLGVLPSISSAVNAIEARDGNELELKGKCRIILKTSK